MIKKDKFFFFGFGQTAKYLVNNLIQSKKTQVILTTLGADYTLPILNGVLIMAETMYASNKNNDQNKIKY